MIDRKPWRCPDCHKMHAPHVDHCDCQPPATTSPQPITPLPWSPTAPWTWPNKPYIGDAPWTIGPTVTWTTTTGSTNNAPRVAPSLAPQENGTFLYPSIFQ